MEIEMRLAALAEAKLCITFIDEAREYQNEQGFVQWTKDYPNIDTILADIHACRGYLLLKRGLPFGYICIDFAGDPAYEHIDGAWSGSQKYAVIHRMAFGTSGRGKGYAKYIFRLAKKLCIAKNVYSLRIDTDISNKGMQHILAQEGYKYCGNVLLRGGSKLAFELDF